MLITLYFRLHNGMAIIRARFRGNLLELIPPEKFYVNRKNFDLPASLINNCVHWLDLSTGEIEVRQPPNIWKSKIGNWRINVHTQQGYRRNSTLVNPQSRTFQAITSIFDHFEDSNQITVYQPEKGALSVELRRLELSFSVNPRGWLESQQLGAEINGDRMSFILPRCSHSSVILYFPYPPSHTLCLESNHAILQ
jgi:hypothetical protein